MKLAKFYGLNHTLQLSVKANPSDAIIPTITWSTSNSKIATVSNGKVTGKGVGTATITAKTSNGKSASCKVTVEKIQVSSLKITVGDVLKNKTGNIETEIKVVDSSKILQLDTDYKVTYSSERNIGKNVKITIEGKGNYTGKKEYTKKIYHKFDTTNINSSSSSFSKAPYIAGELIVPINPKYILKSNITNDTLKQDVDFTVTYSTKLEANNTRFRSINWKRKLQRLL